MTDVYAAKRMGRAYALGIAFGRGLSLAFDEAKWITVHPNGKGPNLSTGEDIKGRRMLIDGETGTVLGGAGGKFTGKKIGNLHDDKKPTAAERKKAAKIKRDTVGKGDIKAPPSANKKPKAQQATAAASAGIQAQQKQEQKPLARKISRSEAGSKLEQAIKKNVKGAGEVEDLMYSVDRALDKIPDADVETFYKYAENAIANGTPGTRRDVIEDFATANKFAENYINIGSRILKAPIPPEQKAQLKKLLRISREDYANFEDPELAKSLYSKTEITQSPIDGHVMLHSSPPSTTWTEFENATASVFKPKFQTGDLARTAASLKDKRLDSPSDPTAKAFRKYTANYDLIDAIRGRNGAVLTQKDKADIALMDAALKNNRTTRPITVFRAVDAESDHILDMVKKGKYTDICYSSTSGSLSICAEYANQSEGLPCILQMNVPKGYPALNLNGNLSEVNLGQEVLLGRNVSAKVSRSSLTMLNGELALVVEMDVDPVK